MIRPFPVTKKFRRKIGRMIRAGKLPAQKYKGWCSSDHVLYLFSQNATVVAYLP